MGSPSCYHYSGIMSNSGNIVVIECDSMDGRVMGCMGHPAMRRATPNLDALAARGTLFRNTYSNSPICVPSRSSMFSGQWTHHCRGWNNYKGLEPGTPTFLSRLLEAGYNTASFGKTDYLSGRHTVRARVTPWTRAANIPRPAYSDHSPVVRPGDAQRVHVEDWEDVDASIQWLRRARGEDRPLMLYLGLRAPHPGFTTSQFYWGRIDGDAVGLPGPDDWRHPSIDYLRTLINWEHGCDDDMVRRTRRVYLAMISEVDAMVGALLAALGELGLTDSTTVLFLSDHGEMAMEHRLVYKMAMFEPSVRVPMIVAGPELPRGQAVDELVSLVDVYPTLMDLAGRPLPDGLDGQSLVPLLHRRRDGRPDWVLSQCHDSGCNTGFFMVRRGRWKYIAYPGYPSQLFDLEADPGELHDLAAARPAVAAEMDGLLRQAVDYEAVDAEVKAYDRECFAAWRRRHKGDGTYDALMAKIYSGWEVPDERIQPWRPEDEARIERWLAGGDVARASCP